jgi:hypothetical protein
MLQGSNVRLSQIRNVHIVPYRCAVFGGIVTAVDFDGFQLSECRFDNAWDQVCFRNVYLAELAVRISSCRIEVAQRGPAQIVSAFIPFQYSLDEEFRVTVWADGEL